MSLNLTARPAAGAFRANVDAGDGLAGLRAEHGALTRAAWSARSDTGWVAVGHTDSALGADKHVSARPGRPIQAQCARGVLEAADSEGDEREGRKMLVG